MAEPALEIHPAYLFLPEIRALLAEKNYREIRTILDQLWPQDIVEIVRELEPPQAILIFRLLPHKIASHVFSELSPELAERILRGTTQEEAKDLISEMDPDDRTALLDDLPSDMVRKLLELLTPQERQTALRLLAYPERSCGRRMSPRYVAVFEGTTVGEVRKILVQKEDLPEEVLQEVYVLSNDRILKGGVTLLSLLRSDDSRKVEELITRIPLTVSAYDDQEQAVSLFKKYDLKTLPVVDRRGELVGVITVDDILDVMEEEVTEDMYRLAGVEVPDVDYPQVSLWEIYKKRILWLTLLFLSESLTSTVILHYEEFLARVTTLAAYIPLLIGTGGNVGSQISTLVVRGMATGKVPIASFQKILIKEILTGLALGSTMGIYMWLRITTFRHTPEIAITVGLAMTAIAFFANLVGSSLPFLFRLLKVDPAVTSSPFIATLMDVIGLLIYFQIAHWILHL